MKLLAKGTLKVHKFQDDHWCVRAAKRGPAWLELDANVRGLRNRGVRARGGSRAVVARSAGREQDLDPAQLLQDGCTLRLRQGQLSGFACVRRSGTSRSGITGSFPGGGKGRLSPGGFASSRQSRRGAQDPYSDYGCRHFSIDAQHLLSLSNT